MLEKTTQKFRFDLLVNQEKWRAQWKAKVIRFLRL